MPITFGSENSHASIFNKSDGKASNPHTHHIYDIGRRNLIYINCTGRVEKSGLLALSLFTGKRWMSVNEKLNFGRLIASISIFGADFFFQNFSIKPDDSPFCIRNFLSWESPDTFFRCWKSFRYRFGTCKYVLIKSSSTKPSFSVKKNRKYTY